MTPDKVIPVGDVGETDKTTRRERERILLQNIRKRRVELEKFLSELNQEEGSYENLVYRYYHVSFKVYWYQETTLQMFELLKSLCPGYWSHMADKIVKEGTGLIWDHSHNADWSLHTQPILTAFFHMKYFLEMAVRYSKLEEPPAMLPFGYAGLLYFYGLR